MTATVASSAAVAMAPPNDAAPSGRRYAWVVFALTFGLMLLLALIYPFVVRDYKTVALPGEGGREVTPLRLRVRQIESAVFAARHRSP